jgi:hypothetical protein
MVKTLQHNLPSESDFHIPSFFTCYFATAFWPPILLWRTSHCTSDALSHFSKIQRRAEVTCRAPPLHRYFHFRRPPRYLVASEKLSDLSNLSLFLLFLDIQKHSIHIHEQRLRLLGEEILDHGFIILCQSTLDIILYISSKCKQDISSFQIV